MTISRSDRFQLIKKSSSNGHHHGVRMQSATTPPSPNTDPTRNSKTDKAIPTMNDIVTALQAVQVSDSPHLDRPTSVAAILESIPPWTNEEHDRFFEAIKKYPSGPYERLAAHVGTKTISDVKNYAVKCCTRLGGDDQEIVRRLIESVVMADTAAVGLDEELKAEPAISAISAEPKRHRVRAWIRATFERLTQFFHVRRSRRRERRERREGSEPVSMPAPRRERKGCAQMHSYSVHVPRAASVLRGTSTTVRGLEGERRSTAEPTAPSSLSIDEKQQPPRSEDDHVFDLEDNISQRVELNDTYGYHSSTLSRDEIDSIPGMNLTMDLISPAPAAVPQSSDNNSEMNEDTMEIELMRLLQHQPCSSQWALQKLQGYELGAFEHVLAQKEYRESADSTGRIASQYSGASFAHSAPIQLKRQGPWSSSECERYREGLQLYPNGPWKSVANHVGTRTERQVRSHSQSIRDKRKRDEDREQRCQSVNDSCKKQSGASTAGRKKSVRVCSLRGASGKSLPSKMNKPTPMTYEEMLIASMATVPPKDGNSRCPSDLQMNKVQRPDSGSTSTSKSMPRSGNLDISALDQTDVNNTARRELAMEIEKEELLWFVQAEDKLQSKQPITYAAACSETDESSFSPLLDMLLGSYEGDEDVLSFLDTMEPI